MKSQFELYKFQIGDILTLRKMHPCGSYIWTVERVGQDIAIRCNKCGHLLLLNRRNLEKAVKKIESAMNTQNMTKEI